MTVPFTPDRAMHLDHDGHLWWGITDQYRLVQQRVEGDSIRIIERAYEPLPVQEVEAQNALEPTASIGQPGWSVEGPPVPDFKPAFRSFFLDDSGHLWVYPHLAPEDDGRVLEIFDPVGRFLGRVRLPFVVDMSIMPLVRGGALYAVTRDEFDVQYVARVRITRG
jgi:hypothetical protein